MSTLNNEVYIAVDIGSSSIRISAYNNILVEMFSLTSKHTIGKTIDVGLCWDKICQMTRKIIANIPRGYLISGVGITSLLAWVVVDKNGDILGPAYTWMDQCNNEMQKLKEKIDYNKLYNKTGRPISSEFGGFKLVHIKKNNPQDYQNIYSFLSLKDYINMKLTGKFIMDRTTACYTYLYNINRNDWDKDILKALGLSNSYLPELSTGNSLHGKVTIDAGKATGIPIGTPVAVSGPDGSVGILGAGGIYKGRAVNLMGTTDVFFAVSNNKIFDESKFLVVNPHVIDGLWLVGGPMSLSGGAISWVVEKVLLNNLSYEEINMQVSKIRAGCEGLMMIPSLTGERAPFWKANIKGTVVGIELKHTAVHFIRAIMEANSFSVKRMCELCKKIGINIKNIIAIGGATRFGEWGGIKADITEVEILIPKAIEATSIGCIILTMIATGRDISDIVDYLPKEYERITPREKNHKLYSSLYSQYLRLLEVAEKYYQ